MQRRLIGARFALHRRAWNERPVCRAQRRHKGAAPNDFRFAAGARRSRRARRAYPSMDDVHRRSAERRRTWRDGAIVRGRPTFLLPVRKASTAKHDLQPGLRRHALHHWTRVLRPLMRADDPKLNYFPYGRLRTRLDAQDSYAALCSAWAIAVAGITPRKLGAQLRIAHRCRNGAMRDSGSRGRFAYGNPGAASNDKTIDCPIWRAQARLGRQDGMLTARHQFARRSYNRGPHRQSTRTWRRRNGRGARLGCRSPCTRPASRHQRRSTTPACSARRQLITVGTS